MNFRLLWTACLLAVAVFNASAQDLSRRWGIGIGLGLKDYENLPVDGSFDFNSFSPAIYGHIGRVLAPSWELQLSGMVPIPNYSYFSSLEPINQANFHLHYRINNGYLLKSTSGFGPYLTAGVSSNFRDFQDSVYTLSIPVGLGFRLQPAKFISFHLSGHYHLAAVANRAQPQVSFQTGFTFHLGKSREIEEKPGKNDQDGDGVKDKKDQCPSVAGLKKFDGCPDSDGDGVPDKEDPCQNIPGVASNQGCPEGDLDQDGLVGDADKCPAAPGTLQGCPDNDNDQVPDYQDECPTEAGTPQSRGCPDADGDGVPDKDDRCPNESGLLEYDGCSLSPEDPTDFLRETEQKINFVEKSAELLAEGEFALNELANYLLDKPDRKIRLYVYTDNNGELYQLYRLSQARAAACQNFLVAKGVSALQVEVKAYGPFMPIEDNFSPLQAKSNNRVQIRMLEN